MALHLNRLESSSSKDALCEIWLILDFKIVSIFIRYFVIKVVDFHFNKFDPLYLRMLCAKFVIAIDPVVLEKNLF